MWKHLWVNQVSLEPTKIHALNCWELIPCCVYGLLHLSLFILYVHFIILQTRCKLYELQLTNWSIKRCCSFLVQLFVFLHFLYCRCFFFVFFCFSFPFHSVKWVNLLSLHSPKSSTREFLKFPPHFGNGSLWCVTKVTHELLCYFFFQLKNGDSDTYIYQGDLMGPNPAHSTHSDQQSVDLYDYINQWNWSKIFINALAIKKYIHI